MKDMACLKKEWICVFYCLYYVEDILVDMVEEQLIEKTDPDPEGEDDFIISEYSGEHWK